MAYSRRKKRPDPLEFPVKLKNPYTGELETVTVTAKHLWAQEFYGLDDVTLGQVKRGEADKTGASEVHARRLMELEYVTKIDGVSDEDIEEFGPIDNPEAVKKYLFAAGNEELAFVIHPTYKDYLFRATKSETTEDSGGTVGEDALSGPQGVAA